MLPAVPPRHPAAAAAVAPAAKRWVKVYPAICTWSRPPDTPFLKSPVLPMPLFSPAGAQLSEVFAAVSEGLKERCSPFLEHTLSQVGLL